MKISLAEYGGQLAALRLGRAPASLDSETLPLGEAAELSRLVGALEAEPEEGASPAPGGDMMSYAVTVDGEGGSRTYEASDQTMSPAFAELRRWLKRRLDGI